MILTVIVPDKQPGMQRMLAEELQFIDSEIIFNNWRSGLKTARGDFVLLLEKDSAIEKGGVTRLIAPFVENPLYRKLAMVSPKVEFDDTSPLSYTFDNEELGFSETTTSVVLHETRIGSVAGAVIRRSTLTRFANSVNLSSRSPAVLAFNFSMALWSNGLRVAHDPEALYYSPKQCRSMITPIHAISMEAVSTWRQELIA